MYFSKKEEKNLKGTFRKGLASLLALSLTLGMGTAFAAPAALPEEDASEPEQNVAEDAVDYSAYEPGVTVEEDENSPTGYTATFVYVEEDSYDGIDGEIGKVELYSDCFMLFDPAVGEDGVLNADDAIPPEDYEAGLAPGGGDGSVTYYKEMTEFEDGMWGAQLPLSSGAFVYNFRVTDAENPKNQVSRLDDPSNPTLENTVTGYHSLSSMVYVPYNEDTMGDGQWANRSLELPLDDEDQRGTVETVGYEGADGTVHGLAVYLPAGYDFYREEPYNVLYLSHGTSGDKYGDELRWMHEGAVANIMDNLIAQGKIEPFVVVTMNNQEFGVGPNWDYSLIEEDQIDYIMPYVEKHYNVSTEASGRAYAGLSMGGSTASNMLMYHPDLFSYYGIWSYSNDGALQDEDVQDRLSALTEEPNIMLAYGKWDFGLPSVQNFGAGLDSLGMDYMELEVPAAHDWENWQLTYAYAAENFFWQNTAEEPSGEFDGYDAGVTVEKDASSPTGYTATFIYEEQSLEELNAYVSYNTAKPQEETSSVTLTGDVAKVEIYSDCFMLFDPEDPEMEKGVRIAEYADKGLQPYDYRAGLVPAGGNGQTAVSIELEEFADGMWGVQVPLSSGAFVYNYRITDTSGVSRDRYEDPANPTLWNEATGIHSLSSMVYVPYDADKQGDSQWADRSVELPRTDGKTGQIVTASYMGANVGSDYATNERGLAIYLPYGYDEDRAEPYKVLYISMGTSGDHQGNELRWLQEGDAANIMDNLIAEGKAEPFIIVSMNNQDLGTDRGSSSWDREKAWEEQELIFAYMEENYNVGETSAYRAYAGLSQGGGQTAYMLAEHTDAFDYYGVYSAGSTASGTDIVSANIDKIKAEKDRIHVYAGTGYWDGLYNESLYQTMVDNGIDAMFTDVPGAHDWEAWQLLLADSVENFFWKDAAEEPSGEFDGYDVGVTVEADENSPTGYNAVFIFDEDSVDCAQYGLADVAKVQVYSDGMFLFSYDEQEKGTPLDPKANAHDPDEFEIGMYPAGGDTSGDLYGGAKIAYYADMEEFADGMWGVKIPLTSGATYYNYRLTDSTGKADSSYIDDPANPAMENTVSGVKSRSSMVYVPYDAEKMGTGDWADRTVENPRTDGKTGTVEFASYTGTQGADRYLGIYLPYGYDENRAEPYNVLYMSHGAQSEFTGCELRWLNECAAVNIMDNLEGGFIVVTVNNTGLSGGNTWDYDEIWAEQQLVMDYIESNYNVGTAAENRGYAGLSMGGMTASRMYAYHADQFGYIGIWSYADTAVLGSLTDEEKAALAAQDCKISIGAGDWDYLLGPVETFAGQLDELGVDYDFLTVPGSHDWRTWQAMFAETVENFFWKDSAEPSGEYDGYDLGVTVEEDENSPTGYTATFLYKEEASYAQGSTASFNPAEDPVAKVELYSDCFYLFDPAENAENTAINPDNAITPDQYQPGLMPAGGTGDTTYYAEMINLGGGLWGVQVPLSSGAFVYNFRVTSESGVVVSRQDDPSNPTLTNTATGIHSLSSMVYVPYNEETMGTGDWADRSLELPQADPDKRGTVETVAYTGANGDLRGLAVYLPVGYDADRDEPYNVLYLSHGSSGDQTGNELRWMNEGAAANIMDNLIAAGKAEPFVVVTMNNQDLGWDYDRIEDDQFNYIMPYIEENYNVSTTAEGRAYAGLSAGGRTTNRMYFNHADEFAYFGIWSYACTGDELAAIDSYENLDKPELMLGAGQWDYLLGAVQNLAAALDERDISYDYLEVPAAHDWETWQMLYAYAVENFFWQDDSSSSSSGSSSGSRYSIRVEDADNGSVDANYTSARRGTTVTITAEPDDGYELDSLTVTQRNGDTVRVTSKGDAYTFTMPSSTVTVKAVFVEAGSASGFRDVDSGDYYYDAVRWAVDEGITAGTSATTFSPDAACTRAQVVTFLWRANGSPEPKSSVNPFTDVAAGSYYEDAVLWAVEQGITAGTSDTTFSPDASCTRGQIVTFLWRANGSPAAASSASFTDVSADAYYYDAVAWAASNGITSGTSATTFSPDMACTRGQIVTFLYQDRA